MSEIASIVRLRWTMYLSAMRGKPMSIALYALGTLFAVAIVAGTGALCWTMNAPDAAGLSGLRDGMLMVGAVLSIGGLLMQIMSLGQGEVLSASKFELFGIRDGALSAGLLAAAICGMPGLTILFALLAVVPAYRSVGVAVMVAGVVSAFLAVITIFTLLRILTTALSSVRFSKKGKNILYVVVFVILMVLSQLPNMFDVDYADLFMRGARATGVLSVLAWTPFAAAFQIPFDVADGQWLALVGRLLVLAVTWAFCHWLCMWQLRKARADSGTRTMKAASGAKGIGMFRFVPDNASGAISARLAIYMRKDVRQISMLVIPLLLVVMAVFRGTKSPDAVWQALLIGPLFVMICEGNGLAYDGRGTYMEAICGVRGWHDRLGRARVNVAMITVYTLLLTLFAFIVTGYWKTPERILEGLIYTVAAISVGLCSIGVAEVTSCAFMYPVSAMDRPFSGAQGRGISQFLFPVLQIVASIVTVLPGAAVAVLLLIANAQSLMWIMIPVSLVNGLAVLLLGSWLGGKLMDARMPKILSTLEEFASLQQ